MQAIEAEQAMTWQAVCERSDLIADSGVVVWLDGDQIALFYLPEAGEGRVLYAIDNHDPRSGANVLGRGIVGYLQGELVAAAPLYKQHYCFSDGRCLEAPDQHVRVWPVRLNGDRVEIGRM